MKTGQQSRYLATLLFTVILFVLAKSDTDPLEVLALRDLYKSLNNPQHLRGWKLEGGDPCGEVWMGISCSGSSVVDLQLRGLKLLGSLGNRLQDLHNLKNLDVSFNNLQGEIPCGLPPNAIHVNMAYNNFTESIPFSLPLMTSLQSLNLSHNSLSGPLGHVFSGLQIKEMDLSFNNLTGDLPSSFGSLMNLTSLYLQNNRFTGSVIYLADLPLADLNIKDNEFSGVIPSNFQSIPHLWIWGNKFHVEANYKPWKFASVVVGLLVLMGSSSLAYFRPAQVSQPKVFSAAEIQLATNNFSEENLLGEGPLGSVYTAKLLDVRKVTMPLHGEEQFPKVLQTATKLRHPNIATLLGFCIDNNDQHFLIHQYVRHLSLYNSTGNLVDFGRTLDMDIGVPQGPEEVGNFSLYNAMHVQEYKPLSWGLRLRIAIGVARALDYLHSSFSPPIVHSNLKATNILLDEQLTPRIADCGLASLRPLVQQNTGYTPPEDEQERIKSDVYALGVLLLELLRGRKPQKRDIYALGVLLLELFTGRKAFDSSRPRGEELLVKWASTRSVEQMIDQSIAGTVSREAASEYAEIISLCTQEAKARRPAASEIVEALTALNH